MNRHADFEWRATCQAKPLPALAPNHHYRRALVKERCIDRRLFKLLVLTAVLFASDALAGWSSYLIP